MDEMINCLNIITKPKDAPTGSLAKALQKLDEIVLDPSNELHPRLKHFLQNRSYEKALIWLNDGQPEKGICGE
jgi:hypothetical protein